MVKKEKTETLQKPNEIQKYLKIGAPIAIIVVAIVIISSFAMAAASAIPESESDNTSLDDVSVDGAEDEGAGTGGQQTQEDQNTDTTSQTLPEATIKNIVENPSIFEGETVTITGKITSGMVGTKITRWLNDDEGNRIKIDYYIPGRALASGVTYTVTGEVVRRNSEVLIDADTVSLAD